MPIERADFKPAWWLPGAHAQTLWPYLARRVPAVPYRRERLELPDGDFLDLDWAGPEAGPVVVVVHGLEGCSRSGYVQGLIGRMTRAGWRAAALNLRGRSGEPNRLVRGYHAGDTADLEYVVEALGARPGVPPLALVGYSLGGNIVLKWLGETGTRARVHRAVAVSVPLLLRPLAERMRTGLSRLYLRHFMHLLRTSYRGKFRATSMQAPVPMSELRRLRDFFAFDDRITAPLHGFAGVDDYYRRASSRPWLGQIRVPTLILHAADDPFMTPDVLPGPEELSPAVRLELSPRGGHVGFVGGPWPWAADYWAERRVARFLADDTDAAP